MRTIEHWIGGQSVTANSGRTSAVFNPATGEQTAELQLASVETVNQAVAAAKAAFETWGNASLSQRTKVLYRHQ